MEFVHHIIINEAEQSIEFRAFNSDRAHAILSPPCRSQMSIE